MRIGAAYEALKLHWESDDELRMRVTGGFWQMSAPENSPYPLAGVMQLEGGTTEQVTCGHVHDIARFEIQAVGATFGVVDDIMKRVVEWFDDAVLSIDGVPSDPLTRPAPQFIEKQDFNVFVGSVEYAIGVSK